VEVFTPFGAPVVAADSVRNTFFAADLRLGQNNDTAVGVLRTTAANLLSTTACPSGTQTNSATCWPIGNAVNDVPLNFILFDPQVSVDPRATGAGTGAGDVYLVGTVQDNNNFPPTRTIFLAACTNAQLSCSSSAVPSGSDNVADFPWVQVRSDGTITVTYVNTKTFSSGGFFPFDIKFVTCTPNGAPKAPTCGTPNLVTTENNAMTGTAPGDLLLTNGDRPFLPGDRTFPKHANRLESDGKTVTTFIVYDRCEVPTIGSTLIGANFCSKTDVAITSSTDGLHWSPVRSATSSPAQQFFGTVATDASTETVNIAYFSTQNDPLQQHMQLFLAQIPRGSTTVGTPHLLTSGFADAQSQSPIVVSFDETYGDHLGLAAEGTGTAGQSHAYVGFTWNSVQGSYVGTSNPDINNHLTLFQY
jgi:hypothetical protein